MDIAPPRSREQRKADTLARFERSEDAWVASADADGEAYITPLSYVWDGATFVMATVESGLTGRNLAARDRVRFAIGETRDVIIVEGTVETFTLATVPTDLADAFAAKLWDARRDPKPPVYFRITPRRIQAWREVNELTGRAADARRRVARVIVAPASEATPEVNSLQGIRMGAELDVARISMKSTALRAASVARHRSIIR